MFIFKGVRAKKTEKGIENIKVLGYTTSSEEDLKSILHNFSITIVTFGKADNVEGNIYEFGVKYDDKLVNIIISTEGKIREAFNNFMNSFFIKDIVYIKPYGSDLGEKKINLILDNLKKEFFEEHNKKSKSKVKPSHNEHQISKSDKKTVENLKKEVNNFVKEIREFLPEGKVVYPSLAAELENAIGNLLKYRSTTNLFKIAEHYKIALELSEKLYNKYYDHKLTEEKQELTNNIISNIDIVREYKQYEKVQRVKTIESIDSKEFKFPWYEVIYYKVFGRYGVNLKLLIKELIKRYKLNYFGFEDILKFIQFIIIFLIIEYSLFLSYKLFSHSPKSEELSIYYMILNIAIIGFIITFGKMLIKKIGSFISISIMILLYILFSYIKTYFGL